jgi:transposase
MYKVTRVGVDLAKSVIQVHAVDAKGERVVNRAIKRDKFLSWCRELPQGVNVVLNLTHLMDIRRFETDPPHGVGQFRVWV